MIALVREVPDAINNCELTFLEREPIDVEEARRQHALYVDLLESLDVDVRWLPTQHELPDSVFVEDTAVVLEGFAVITRPGAESRQPEVHSTAEALAEHLPIERIPAPATIDGGDVIVVGRRIFVGLSKRSTTDGVQALAELAEPYGYAATGVLVTGVLHLKSAATAIGSNAILANPAFVDISEFDGIQVIEVHPDEPEAANAVLIGDELVYGEEFPLTKNRLEDAGYRVHTVPSAELAKAEGAVTCCSLLIG